MRIARSEIPVAVDFGDYVGKYAALGGMHFAFEKCAKGYTIDPMLAAYADNACPVEHWGLMFKGSVLVKYTDGTEETFVEGDAYHVPPGHRPYFLEDSELLQITRADEHAELIRTISEAGLLG
ncbi:hypothetical protein [Umezawaea sp. NPDC059074]|uniref:hypothetical protein n=1 Tax=Umezawaea sp. NPDC059074 TaxID=3346716 RepID=UPI0036AE594A